MPTDEADKLLCVVLLLRPGEDVCPEGSSAKSAVTADLNNLGFHYRYFKIQSIDVLDDGKAERNLMMNGMDYDHAHQESSKLERKCRRHPDQLHDELAKEGWESVA